MVKNKKPGKGFTLLELILVLTILAGTGFMLVIKLPLKVHSQSLTLTSAQLLTELRDTRQAAMSENTWYKVKFYYGPGYYQIMRQGVRVKQIDLEEGIVFANSPPDLIFNARGIPNVGLTVLLKNAEGEIKKVIVAPVSGRIREE
ncbi:MAG: prepilin-type N-terminal cleavage/methylation domain-containing protein [Desulfitobacteriaceae bacterium]|nr:prepilin-type N-terminal cleavage/methylation domain-containing protein [Desulfitobacteriaceae bacterium]MDD4401589.1 prepilin-type N-terminal cleavage/methylation domain-containing protein [Desulfitobacteriaceae bacterium]